VIGARTDIWTQRLWVWVSALAFLAINGIGLLVYQFAYSDRVKTLQLDLRDQNQRLTGARADRQHLQDLLRQARINRERVWQLYDEHFSTRRRRLTGVTAEVKDLARRAGLQPRSISYPEEQIQQYGLIKRSFIFSVDGTYADLRKFVNLLELSDSFLTLEDISLSEEGPGRRAGLPAAAVGPPRPAVPGGGPAPVAPAAPGALRMAMTISTLFALRVESPDALAPLPGANAGANAGAAPAPPRGSGRTP
jgi:Tfp pilus assembly protein PilO